MEGAARQRDWPHHADVVVKLMNSADVDGPITAVTPGTVDVHIRRLRSKIETGGETYIDTVRHVGYKFLTVTSI